MMPLLGAARISHAMAPRKGGVTKEASTSARTVSSPAFWAAGREGPIPPETASNGSGVTTRTAMPARNSAKPALVVDSKSNQSKRGNFVLIRSAELCMKEG